MTLPPPPPGGPPPPPPLGGPPPPVSTPPLGQPPGPGDGVPWERQGELGFGAAFIATIRESLLHPVAFFRRLEPRGPIGTALVFAVLVTFIGTTFAVMWQLAIPGVWEGVFRTRGDLGGDVISPIAQWLLTPVLTPLLVLLAGAVYHVVLLLFGGPSRGLPATIRVVAYSSAPNLLLIVPFCGSLLAGVWIFVLYVLGLREVHGIQTGKAVAVVIVPLLLCLVVLGIAIALVLVTAGAGGGRGLF